ncbi:MAG TPA: hypothetical protein VFX45_00140 [Solirubrobacterales bacterium]|nr:hypothetical protein [Solirubrobacterales bacterium]
MYRMREAWTDERLDDLSSKVDDGFRRMEDRFAHVDARFDAAQREMNARFEAMHRLVVQVSGGMIGTFVIAAAAVVATQI